MNYEIVDNRSLVPKIHISDLKEGQFGVEKDGNLWLRTDNGYVSFEDGSAVEYGKSTMDNYEEPITLINVKLVINN